jgi:drug/metabolite transporter (DMT)-like permease
MRRIVALEEPLLNPGYLFLVVHIFGSVSFGHIMKWSLRRNASLVAVGSVNYVVASIGSFIVALLLVSPSLGTSGYLAALLGGLSYVVSFYFYYQAIRLTGVSISTSVIRLAVVPAIVASILLWGEHPVPHQVVGILLILVALPLLSRQPSDKSANIAGPVWGWLLALFVTTSGGSIAAKLFQETGDPSSKPLLLGFWFGIAALVAILALARQRLRPTRDDLPLGVLLGAVNVAANTALLAALDHLPAAIVFPAASGGGVMLVAVTSALLWGERLSRPALIGVVIALPALVLVNLP